MMDIPTFPPEWADIRKDIYTFQDIVEHYIKYGQRIEWKQSLLQAWLRNNYYGKIDADVNVSISNGLVRLVSTPNPAICYLHHLIEQRLSEMKKGTEEDTF